MIPRNIRPGRSFPPTSMVVPRRIFSSRGIRQAIRHNSTAPSLQSSRVYSRNLLRKYDIPSHIQTGFIPSTSRDAHLAICALNIELALIFVSVSNQHARVMRMQFWKDAIDACFQGRPKAEPVSILLAHVLLSRRLSKSFFQTVISERVCSLRLLKSQ